MKCYIGFGSNIDDRMQNLEAAATLLARDSNARALRASPVYETEALIPRGADESWRIPFLNAVVELEWTSTAEDLLAKLKSIEAEVGRKQIADRWAPRIIDLDLLLFGQDVIDRDRLKVPHEGVSERSFVLDPLKDLSPTLVVPGKTRSVLELSREMPSRMPLWMGILNLTPDSFSDGGQLEDLERVSARLEKFANSGVQILDLGAESTRPGARSLSWSEEWARLQPTLKYFAEKYRGRFFKPRLSLDTRHARTAALGLEYGIDIINDVSGCSDPEMADVLRKSGVGYVLMHSLTVPADRSQTLKKDSDPVIEIREWTLKKLDAIGVGLERIILDPGIGFGKTAHQSRDLLARIEEFFPLGLRVLIGHSRKSFLQTWTPLAAENRDLESIGVSLAMANRGVDILRVHEPELHIRAYRSFHGVGKWNR